MPRLDLDRDEFVRRMERRRRWAHRRGWLRGKLGSLPRKGWQAMIYDLVFRSDAEAVAYHYALANDHMPDFEAPAWINEKVRWQFLNHPNPLMSLAADKIAVRSYLKLKGAAIAAPELIATGTAPAQLAEIDLPERFVLKSANGSGQNHVEACRPATPRQALVEMAEGWRRWDHWRRTGELHYRALPKRWLVEEFIPARREQLEFKFFCLQGEPVFVTVITERRGAAYRKAAYDLHWNRLELGVRGAETDPRPVPRPPELDQMIDEARRLSADFLHVRVDFMKFDGRLLFSELTFANLAAREPFEPLAANRELGERMDLARAPDYLERGRRAASELGWRTAA
jgi:hypothetical protein